MKQERPSELESVTTKVPTGLGNMYLTITFLDKKPFELFATISKSGKEVHAMTEALGRMISLWLRSGESVDDVVDQLIGIAGENPLAIGKGVTLSIPDGIAQVLQKLKMKGEKDALLSNISK